MIKMVEAHDRLQRAAAEMNTLRFSTRNFPDIDMLSQQLSQIPADLSGSPIVSSPVSHRSKRSRSGDTPLTRRLRVPLTTLNNRVNVVTSGIENGTKDVEYSGSVTQDEEEVGRSPVKRIAPISSDYADLIPDEEGFSQFDI